MTSATVTSLDGVLKVYYDSFKIKTMQYNESPLLAILPRMTKFGGKNLPIPIVYNTPQGTGANVAAAQSVASPSKNTDFILTRVSDFGVVTISNEAMEAAEDGDKAAFVSAKVTEIDGIFTQLVRSLSTGVYGSGTGTIGQVGTISAGASGYIILKDIEQVVNFDVGQVITASSGDGTGACSGSSTLTAVDYDSGTIYLDTTAISGITTNYYLQGNSYYNAKITGLSGWIPASAPGATSFFGVDRSVSPNRLGGIRIPSSIVPAGIAIEEKIMRAVARVAREGAKPTHVILNTQRFADLQASLGTRVQFGETTTADGEFGFRTIRITCGTNTVEILADPYCPSNVFWILQLDTWKLYSLREVPRFENSDGLKMLRQATADGVEVRAKYYAQLGCVAPGKNGRCAL